MTRLTPATNRIVHAEGIGYSSHKNSYSRGTLENNWYEDRTTHNEKFDFSPKYESLNYTSTSAAAFTPQPMESRTSGLETAAMEARALPGSMLFGHGKDFEQRTMTSTASSTFQNFSGGSGSRGVAAEPAQRLSLTAKKQAEWDAQKHERYNPSEAYKPTVHREHDASHSIMGVTDKRALVADSPTSKSMRPKRGEFTKACEADWLATGLRSADSRAPKSAL
eukprot:ANDGO_02541.mRNA.1 hypothetical protein